MISRVEDSLGYAVWRSDLAAVPRLLEGGCDVDRDVWRPGAKTPLMESLDEHVDFYDEYKRRSLGCLWLAGQMSVNVTRLAGPRFITVPGWVRRPWPS